MAGPELSLKVRLHRSPLDARRGIVRVHRSVLEVLGIDPWEALALAGSRTTAAMAATAPPDSPPGEILMDDITCANAGISPGDLVRVAPGEVRPAEVVKLDDLPETGPPDPATLRLALLGKILTAGDQVALLPQDFRRPKEAASDLESLIRSLHSTYGHAWREIVGSVASTAPGGSVRVTMETQVVLAGGAETMSSATPMDAATTGHDLPGLEDQFDRLRELFDLSFNRSELLARLGARSQLGVLVTGPPGSGKGALTQAVAASVKAKVVSTWAPALARIEGGAAATQLRALFAESARPAVVVVEDVEAIAPRDEPGPLLDLLRELISETLGRGGVAVVCTTAHPEATSPTLRRPGVLDQEIEIPLPDAGTRRRILELQTHGLPLAPDVDLAEVGNRTPGFVAADLIALCREASLRAAQRLAAQAEAPPFVGAGDFDAALEVVTPSSLDGIRIEVADILLDDVGDMDEIKSELTEAVIWPLRYPDTFERLGVEPSKGVLLFGPPGCGKTFIVKALVNEANANFLSVKGAELLSKWVGESERSVRELFRRARSAAPSVVLLDEIDALAPARGAGHDSGATDRVVAQLLTELDGVEELHGVFVIGATNRPELVDPALLRPGRLERLVYVPPPDGGARGAILAAAARRMPLESDLDLDGIAAACEGFSAADLAALARRAALVAMRERMDAPVIEAKHFAAARESMAPSLRREVIGRLTDWAAQHTSG